MSTPIATQRNREQKCRDLWQLGVRDVRQLAAELGVTDRTVYRMTERLKLRERRPVRDYAPDYARLAQLAEEGMPANWIAEDICLSYEVTQRHAASVPGHREHVREWTSVWHAIRQRPELLALHYEFSPIWSAMMQHRRKDAA